MKRTCTCFLFSILFAVTACGTTANSSSGGPVDSQNGSTDAIVSGADSDSTSGTDVSSDLAVNDDGVDFMASTDINSAEINSTDSGGETSEPGTCPPVLKDKSLSAHGKTCTQDSECMYGVCQKGGFLVGYDSKIGYCTKDCGCAEKTAQCSDDNASGAEFICGFEKSTTSGNDKAGSDPEKRCALRCKTDGDCAKWNSALPHCIGSTKYVSSAGVCGFDPFK